MDFSLEEHNRLISTLSAMEVERQMWWPHWRLCADYYMPRRYNWLATPQERQNKMTRNTLILDATGTTAGKTLASGLMNGITSPSRPWLKLRIPGISDEDYAANVWLDEVTRRMLTIMAQSNFYNAMGVIYLDLSFFGTAACLIYEDFEDVFRCYNCALGEFYLGQDDRQKVNRFGREFTQTIDQLVRWFGLENCSETVKQKYESKNASQLDQAVNVAHLIEPNDDGPRKVPGGWEFREFYWEINAPRGRILKRSGFNEIPGIFPRWEITGNDSYGSGWPAADALGDVIQIQHETKKKGQALDKTVDPPILANIQLQHKPVALLPRGITYVTDVTKGAQPAYQIQMPFDMLTADISEVQGRVREIFFNDLFKMISQLDTVRSATEIDARREEKLVLLGPVLERFENEALDPAVKRIYGISARAGLFPEAPESIRGRPIEIQYLSVLTAAQTAVATIPTERFLGLVGNVAPIYPAARFVPNWEETLRDYARDLGVRAKNINPPEVTQQMKQTEEENLKSQQDAQTGAVLVDSAKALSETDVGGGTNALSQLINPYGG